MENDILHDLIKVEAEIQDNLENEKRKSCEWLETVRKEAEQNVLREEELLKEGAARSLENAGAEAYMKAAEIRERALSRAAALKSLDTGSVRDIIMKHIVRILPGVKT